MKKLTIVTLLASIALIGCGKAHLDNGSGIAASSCSAQGYLPSQMGCLPQGYCPTGKVQYGSSCIPQATGAYGIQGGRRLESTQFSVTNPTLFEQLLSSKQLCTNNCSHFSNSGYATLTIPNQTPTDGMLGQLVLYAGGGLRTNISLSYQVYNGGFAFTDSSQPNYSAGHIQLTASGSITSSPISAALLYNGVEFVRVLLTRTN